MNMICVAAIVKLYYYTSCNHNCMLHRGTSCMTYLKSVAMCCIMLHWQCMEQHVVSCSADNVCSNMLYHALLAMYVATCCIMLCWQCMEQHAVSCSAGNVCSNMLHHALLTMYVATCCIMLC